MKADDLIALIEKLPAVKQVSGATALASKARRQRRSRMTTQEAELVTAVEALRRSGYLMEDVGDEHPTHKAVIRALLGGD